MTSLHELKRALFINQGLDSAQVRGERGLRIDEVKLCDGACGNLDCVKLGAQLFREREEYARDFALFSLAQGLKLVVRLDCLKRLDEDGRARRGEAVRDASDPATVVASNWNDEAVVADCDKLILYRLFGAAHQGFERARDGRAHTHDVRAYARKLRACAVVQLARR